MRIAVKTCNYVKYANRAKSNIGRRSEKDRLRLRWTDNFNEHTTSLGQTLSSNLTDDRAQMTIKIVLVPIAANGLRHKLID